MKSNSCNRISIRNKSDKEQEVISLKEKLEASTQLTKTETQKEYQEQLNQKDLEISKLNAKLDSNPFSK